MNLIAAAGVDAGSLFPEEIVVKAGASAGAFCALATLASFWLIWRVTHLKEGAAAGTISLVRLFMRSSFAMAVIVALSAAWLAYNNREKVEAEKQKAAAAQTEVRQAETKIAAVSEDLAKVEKNFAAFRTAVHPSLELVAQLESRVKTAASVPDSPQVRRQVETAAKQLEAARLLPAR